MEDAKKYYKLRKELRSIKRKATTELLGYGTRQTTPEEDYMTPTALREHDLIVPNYDPIKLCTIAETSSMVGVCIEAMVNNVHGFGYELQYTGTKENVKSDEVLAEKAALQGFFSRVNETQSMVALKKEAGLDYERTGNAYIEVVPYLNGSVSTLYRADSQYMRLQLKQEETTPITVNLIRNGTVKPTTIHKRFRRFAMISDTTNNIRWFKEYGDPRVMCSISGKYEHELKKNEKIIAPASQIIHIKQGNDTYGVPRWIGIAVAAIGVKYADFVNYDLFENNAIPPLAILVSGGRLTCEAIEDLQQILEQRKGVENFTKVAILEAISAESGDVGDKSANTKIDFKPLPQQNDLLFKDFISDTEKRVRAKFRLPALFSGQTEDFSRSCYSEDTETLTENGWKHYSDIEENEKIATFNPENNRLEYHNPIGGILLYPYKGKMIHFKNLNTDVLVTPDHTMWALPVSNAKKPTWCKKHAEDFMLFDGARSYFKHAPGMLLDIEDKKDIVIPFEDRADTNREPIHEDYRISMDFFLEFLGYFIGDGSTYSKRCQYVIALGAHKERKLEKFKYFAEYLNKNHDMSYCVSKDKIGPKLTYFISNKGLRNWLRSNCGDRALHKHMPEWCLKLNKRQSNILLNALIDTDGTRGTYEGCKSALYYTTSKKLADQVQILAMRCGYRASRSIYPKIKPHHAIPYRVNITYKNHSQIRGHQIKEVDYDGMVYCFEVPNHLFFTRRNGKIAIQGNTSESSKLIAEEQVFRPERNNFDEIINFTIMKDLGAENWAFRTIGPKLIEGSELIDAIGKFARAGSMSINQGIKVMNRVLDLDVPLFDDQWAEYPAAMVLELSKKGYLKGIEEISSASINNLKDNIDKAATELKNQDGYEDIMKGMEDVSGQMEEIYDFLIRNE